MKNNPSTKPQSSCSDALLVTLADRNFINQAKQLFSSVYWNSGWEGDYMLLAHNIPEKELRWFRDKGILIKECKPLYNKKTGKIKHSPVVLDKFYLFTPEFRRWKNIVYLDADIIVRAPIYGLAGAKMFMAGISYLNMRRQFFADKDPTSFADISSRHDLDQKSFNTGVFAFPTKVINEKSFSTLRNLSSKYLKIAVAAEEGILNLYFYKKWKKIPGYYYADMLLSTPIKKERTPSAILHFIGNKKKNVRPWEEKNPFYREWKNNLRLAEKINLKKRKGGKKFALIMILISYASLMLRIKLSGLKTRIVNTLIG